MKKVNFAVLCAALCLTAVTNAQQYRSYPVNSGKDNANGVVYCLPQTDIVIKFKLEKTQRTKGIYSESAYLLGIDNAALKNNVSYRIKWAEISQKISPDYNRQYIIVADNNTLVEKTPAGTIKSITAKGTNAKKTAVTNQGAKPNGEFEAKPRHKDGNAQNQNSLAVEPTYEQKLMQQGLLTRYPQMSAEKAVSEIKRLRDKQIELLCGSWEGTYMNTTVDYMYKQLDEIINSYVSLFTGVQTVSEEEYVFVITPEKPIILEEDLIVPVCKFSATEGFKDLNESGDGVKITAKIHSYSTTEQNAKGNAERYMTEAQKRKMEKDGAGVYYCTGQDVRVTLYGTESLGVSKMMKLMQYSSPAFTTSNDSNIIFDEHTGGIIKMW
ncbi:MAG: DUF4831 family protein [Bacteroidales bacterium]|nr:DUF4831 family protein [Bacteroidales bacterium]